MGGAGHPPEPDGALRRLTSAEGDVPQTWPPGCRSPRDHPVGPQSTVSASELVWPRPSPLDSQPWQRGGLQKCLLGRTRRAWPGAESDGLCHWLLASGKSLAGPAGSCLGYGEGSGRGSRSHQFCGGGDRHRGSDPGGWRCLGDSPPPPSDVVMPLSLPGSYVNLFRSRGWVGVRGGVTEMGVRPARRGEQVSTGGAGPGEARRGGGSSRSLARSGRLTCGQDPGVGAWAGLGQVGSV